MKIAFIDHLPVGTGIIRLATKLAKALVDVDKNVVLEYYTHSSNFNKNRELFECNSARFKVKILASTYPKSNFHYYSKKMSAVLGMPVMNRLKRELESIKGFDIVYFTSAHMSPFYAVQGVCFGTFHDFNWKYSFGMPNFSTANIRLFEKAMPAWFACTVPIASSDFIQQEIEKFYPAHKYPVEVIYLPNIGNEIGDGTKRNYDFPYILYPANICAHKNHLNLYNGLYKLKIEGKLGGVKLILTGAGTDHFKYASLCKEGIRESSVDDFDVLGLGYVNNDVMDSLIKHAVLNLSASIYEAGSVPAIDAWIKKVPFIMSDILPHRNQLEFYKLDCVLFDPFDPSDIAKKMGYALSNPEVLQQMSLRGHEALKKYNWAEAAANYLKVFSKYAKRN